MIHAMTLACRIRAPDRFRERRVRRFEIRAKKIREVSPYSCRASFALQPRVELIAPRRAACIPNPPGRSDRQFGELHAGAFAKDREGQFLAMSRKT